MLLEMFCVRSSWELRCFAQGRLGLSECTSCCVSRMGGGRGES
jgi:hypothetical protein